MFAVVTCLSRWTASSLFPSRIRQGVPDFERELDGDGDDGDADDADDTDPTEVADAIAAEAPGLSVNVANPAQVAADMTGNPSFSNHAGVTVGSLGDGTISNVTSTSFSVTNGTIGITNGATAETVSAPAGVTATVSQDAQGNISITTH
jgi:hypothetical protein